VWSDLKTRVKKKAVTINTHRGGTGGGPPSNLSLTPLEDRVLGIMGYRDHLGGTHETFESQILPVSIYFIHHILYINIIHFVLKETQSVVLITGDRLLRSVDDNRKG
jgi:hypothetical protein